jgi:hypothetical protein
VPTLQLAGSDKAGRLGIASPVGSAERAGRGGLEPPTSAVIDAERGAYERMARQVGRKRAVTFLQRGRVAQWLSDA